MAKGISMRNAFKVPEGPRRDKREQLPDGETLESYIKSLLEKMPMSYMSYRESWALKTYIQQLEALAHHVY